MAVRLLGDCRHKHEIFDLLRHQFNCSSRTCERILARAREELRDRTGKSKDELRQDAVAFYESLIRDSKSEVGTKMYARRELNQLLGIYAPHEHRHAGSDQSNTPVPLEVQTVVVRTRAEAKDVLALIKKEPRVILDQPATEKKATDGEQSKA